MEVREQRELVTLIGANGEGRRRREGARRAHRPARGRVHYNAGNYGTAAHELVGIGWSRAGRARVFARLTVDENLAMGAYTRRRLGRCADFRVYAIFPRLAERRASSRNGVRGRTADDRVRPRANGPAEATLLDEPSMGLAPLMVQKIFETIKAVAAEGVTLLLVEQNAKLALEASHRGYVMESGTIALADTAAALLTNPEVRRAYLGE